MTNQGDRQADTRSVTGTTLTYEGDILAYFDQQGIAAGEFNGRFLAWINSALGTSYTEINGAKTALAISGLAPTWDGLGLLQGASMPWWNSLFSAGETGFVFPAFNELKYLFQDAAGTVPVTVDGNPVGLAKDRGTSPFYDASQATGTKRPFWRSNSGKPYLQFDGVDDSVATAFLPTTAMTMAVAFRSATASGIVLGGGSATQRCYVALDASGRIAGGWGAQNNTVIFGGSDIRNTDHVAILVVDASNLNLYLDGTSVYSGATSGTASGSVGSIALGAWNASNVPVSFSAANVYSALSINRRATVSEIANINSNMRATYP